MNRPDAVAFDVVETLFSLESLRPRLTAVGLSGQQLETWFARFLRDAFALEIAGSYTPFRDVAWATLNVMLQETPGSADAAKVDHVISGFSELDAHGDVAEAMASLQAAGIRIATLTNGSAKITSGLLERAGLRDLVERVISIDDIRHWKPHPAVYHQCAKTLNVERHRLALIAVHPWDIQGARRSGLVTGFVARDGAAFPSVMGAPDVSGSTLGAVVAGLIGAA